MSKIAEEKAFIAYPKFVINGGSNYDHNTDRRYIFARCYEQAAKDIIARVREEVDKIIPDGNDEYIIGERIGYHSVLNILNKLEKEYEQ